MPEDYFNQSNSEVKEKKIIIDKNKFLLLSFITFGLYPVWWVYKAWSFFRDNEDSDIAPALRTVFNIIFLIPLFNKIQASAKAVGYKETYSSVLLFICIIITNLLGNLPDPFWLISLSTTFFYLSPFNALNAVINQSDKFIVEEQRGFNGRQIVLLVFGSIIWFLILNSLYNPESSTQY